MPDKKLTDEEIVNCYEWVKKCNGNLLKNCFGCPLQKHYPYCVEASLDFSFDLINRLQAEKEALINGQETLQKYIADLQAENEKWQGGYMTQKQEIANLEVELKAMRGAANSYKAENESLKTQLYLEKYTDVAKKNIKSEAYKEFAERLKEWFRKESEVYKLIDNLLKEISG